MPRKYIKLRKAQEPDSRYRSLHRILRIVSNEWEQSLDERGYAHLPGILTGEQCRALIGMYDDDSLFRSTIDMARYGFGHGEYRYFNYPLPPVIQRLREQFYSQLAPLANRWSEKLKLDSEYPATLQDLLETCHTSGQERPTPLLLRYVTGDYNRLHQDLYGAVAFPFQVVLFLSDPQTAYGGGEFLLAEQVPRAQTRVRAFRPKQGDALIITTRYRPGQSQRGHYRIHVRHGVSDVTAGERWTLGVIFHDAT